MILKYALIVLTLISVVADTLLLPFYPQFFQAQFGIDSATHVGYFIAACCLTVMLAFPVWARVAKRINELYLWVFTQLIAAALGVACFYTTDIVSFWILFQAMLVFKASYLLIYPFVMRLEEREKHVNVASLFSVLMHFGAIGGAIVGGTLLEEWRAVDVFIIMPVTDIVQVLICLLLIVYTKQGFRNPISSSALQADSAVDNDAGRGEVLAKIRKLFLVSMVFYFAAFLVRPFFSVYWNTVSGLNNEIIAALVYAIPAFVALYCLWLTHLKSKTPDSSQLITRAIFIAVVGLLLQSAESSWSIVAGRVIYGWALFQITVHLEVLLFQVSRPAHYARDFSRLHIFQNIGVMAASFSVGHLVASIGYSVTFILSALVCLLVLGLFTQGVSFKQKSGKQRIPEPETV